MSEELPPGWALPKVADVGRVELGRQRSPEHHNGPNMRPYLRVANVFEDRIDLSDVMQMNFTPTEAEKFKLEPGDILLNEGQSKELVGRPAMYRGELPGVCFTNSLVRFRAYSCLDSRYALQLFRHYLKAGTFQKISTITTNIAHLGAGRFAEVEFPLPPANEQRRIVAKLEDLLARSRRAEAALEAIPPLLEKLRQSILAAAFRGDLTADWRAKNPDVEPAEKLLARIRVERRKKWEEAELAKLNAKGKLPTDERWKAKYQEPAEPEFLNAQSPLPETWTWASVGMLTECLDSQRVPVSRDERAQGAYPYYGANGQVGTIDRFIFDEPLVLVTEDETFYGRTKPIAYAVNGKCWVNNHAHVLRPVSPLNVDFLCAALMHYPVEPWLSGTTGRAKLTQGSLLRLPVALPPLAELHALVAQVQASLRTLERLASWILNPQDRLAALEGVLLAKAFRGELVEQDPDDEPASVMLERLAAERAAAEASKPKPAPTKRARKAR